MLQSYVRLSQGTKINFDSFEFESSRTTYVGFSDEEELLRLQRRNKGGEFERDVYNLLSISDLIGNTGDLEIRFKLTKCLIQQYSGLLISLIQESLAIWKSDIADVCAMFK